ncbi:PREDICTED: methyltransferase-like protein 22 [Drosophila arizonae]|uniref:Methyltransferase-like protein 22 n=1 Tax=Drosophila arizonae TaxID=7263 RepID=A0ABM1P6X2_DROAR|nr:PREDICTED: methyltransferase-like protein 22 [Drosophila arizonae]
MYTVKSEIYSETNYQPVHDAEGNIVSKFRFRYPDEQLPNGKAKVDNDGDLEVQRPKRGIIEIEHSDATELKLVGLQVWRGALLLADFAFHQREAWSSKTILELGAGVGLTSITAAMMNKGQVYCTDVNLGCILELMRKNVQRNRQLLQGHISVLEYDFLAPRSQLSKELIAAIDDSDIILAADVVYDDTLTDAFVAVMEHILERGEKTGRAKCIYMAMEKRYVFTLEDCDSVAPMYEHFLRQILKKPWRMEELPLDFPQYFEYERCPQLVLMRISRR